MQGFNQLENEGGSSFERSWLDKVLGRNTPPLTGPDLDNQPSGSLFSRKSFDNSPLMKQLSLDKIDVKGGVNELGSSLKDIGGGILAGAKEVGPSLLASIASQLNDNRLRNIQGGLAASEAATRPFSTGSISDDFARGPGGSDLPADMQEAFLNNDNRIRRDKQEALRDSLFGLLKDDLINKKTLKAIEKSGAKLKK